MYTSAWMVVALTMHLGVATEDQFASSFVQVSNPGKFDAGNGSSSILIQKAFHQCSMNQNCNFVVENLNTNEFFEFSSEEALPENRDMLKIWEKRII